MLQFFIFPFAVLILEFEFEGEDEKQLLPSRGSAAVFLLQAEKRLLRSRESVANSYGFAGFRSRPRQLARSSESVHAMHAMPNY